MTFDSHALLVHLRVVGVAMAGLVAVNLYAPRRFGWRDELAQLPLLTRQVFVAHLIFLVLTLTLTSALLLADADALLQPSPLARALLAGLTIFWSLRMVMQWSFYSPAIWRGHRFNTAMHYAFSALWVYVSSVFAAAWWTIR